MAEVFIGQLMLVPYTFAPRGFALCNGQLLPIAQNTALFALLGTYYGGDGKSTFGLPNLQGSVAIGMGQATGGGSTYSPGQTGGTQTVTISASSLPAHNHNHLAAAGSPNVASPVNANLGSALPRQPGIYGAAPVQGNKVAMGATALQPAGSGQPHNNMQPTLTLNWVIALQGIFPSRQ